MKYSILSIMFIIAFQSCSPKLVIPFERTGEVEFYSGEKNTITLTSSSYAENESKAIFYSERNALENLLFRGIPGSNQENPMVESETEAYRNSKSALDKLIIYQGYKPYMIQSDNNGSRRNNGGIYMNRLVKFDLQALRKYLEENKVVRKFGL